MSRTVQFRRGTIEVVGRITAVCILSSLSETRNTKQLRTTHIRRKQKEHISWETSMVFAVCRVWLIFCVFVSY